MNFKKPEKEIVKKVSLIPKFPHIFSSAYVCFWMLKKTDTVHHCNKYSENKKQSVPVKKRLSGL